MWVWEQGGPGPDAEEEATEGALEVLQEGRLDGRVAARVFIGKKVGKQLRVTTVREHKIREKHVKSCKNREISS